MGNCFEEDNLASGRPAAVRLDALKLRLGRQLRWLRGKRQLPASVAFWQFRPFADLRRQDTSTRWRLRAAGRFVPAYVGDDQTLPLASADLAGGFNLELAVRPRH